VLVLPSRTTPTWKEQFGRVLIEAMAYGVPVIGSDSGEIPQVIGKAGIIYPERNIEKLVECLCQVRDNSELRSHLIQMGKERVATHFSWQRVAGQVDELIQAVLDKACG
jgi:glycosyltransferase involved in cell wall biosynthesis